MKSDKKCKSFSLKKEIVNIPGTKTGFHSIFWKQFLFFSLKKFKHIDFDLTDVANTLDMPGLRKLINNLIVDSISKTLVLPNRLVIPILTDMNNNEANSYRSLEPKVNL